MVDFVWNEKVLEAKKEIKDLNEGYEEGIYNTKDYLGRMTELVNKWYNVIPDEDVTEVEESNFDIYADQIIAIRKQLETLKQMEKLIEEHIIYEHKQLEDTGRLTGLIHPERITTDKYSIVVEEEIGNVQIEILKREG